MARKRGERKNFGEVVRIVDGYEPSGLTRASYAEVHGITVAALDGYRRRMQRRAGFVEIAVAGGGNGTFSIALGGGARIEIGWAEIDRAVEHGAALRELMGRLGGAEACSG